MKIIVNFQEDDMAVTNGDVQGSGSGVGPKLVL
jgi:hypothetical protein